MKVFLIVIHSAFALLGNFLLFNFLPDGNIKNLLIFILMFYCIGILMYTIIRDILQYSFPRLIGFFIVTVFYSVQLITRNFIVASQDQINVFVTGFSTFIAFYFLLNNIFLKPVKWQYRTIKTSSFRRYYLLNYICFFCLFLAVIILNYLFKSDYIKVLNYLMSVLIVLVPFFNRNYVRGFIKIIQKEPDIADLNFDFDQFGKLAEIRNFVFSKDKFISTGNFQITDSDYRSTVKVMTAMQLAHQLSNDWNKRYAKLFVLDDYERGKVGYSIVEKNEDGISVIDDTATMYHFGNNAFLKNKHKKDESANLILLKNDIPIAKFKVNEKIANDKVAIINQFDYYGNTILFNPGLKEDLGKDYSIVFDKIYSSVDSKRKIELLNELHKEAPTAYICAKKPDSPSTLNFYVTLNIDVKKSDNLIVCSSDRIHFIPHLISLSKKVHTFLKYALIISGFVQISMLIFVLFNINRILLIFGMQLAIFLLAEIASVFFKERINYLPDQPDNLAHNHHTA